jgi:20S proteasome alpha/beta subunit
MSLGMVFKGPEGIVLGADSRVTLTFQATVAGPAAGAMPVIIPATYDNATKLLKVSGQDHVAAITYGVGVIGQTSPRTAHSYLPEFEEELAAQPGRISVEDFAAKLSDFFNRQWQSSMPPGVQVGDMIFLVAGYNENEAYGRVYQLSVPNSLTPTEQNHNDFGLTYGGQHEITARILSALDDGTVKTIMPHLNVPPAGIPAVIGAIRQQHALKIPYQFLPLQDCVDLTILLINTTAELMRFVTDVRGVGGPIDVATITRTEGFKYVQAKQIHGERSE